MLNNVFGVYNVDDIGAFSLVIGGSIIIILSYFANVLAKKTNIPSVLVLIAMGIALRQIITAMGIEEIPFESVALELLGTVGLIFILLEAALDLELSKEKLPLILKSASLALFTLAASSAGIAWLLNVYSFGVFHPAFHNEQRYYHPVCWRVEPRAQRVYGLRKHFL